MLDPVGGAVVGAITAVMTGMTTYEIREHIEYLNRKYVTAKTKNGTDYKVLNKLGDLLMFGGWLSNTAAGVLAGANGNRKVVLSTISPKLAIIPGYLAFYGTLITVAGAGIKAVSVVED